MLRKNVRLRKEYLFRKNLEDKEQAILDRKRKLREALDTGKAIPTDIRGEERNLRKKLDLTDDKTEIVKTHIDDEYAFAGGLPLFHRGCLHRTRAYYYVR